MSEAYRLLKVCDNSVKKFILNTDNAKRDSYTVMGFKCKSTYLRSDDDSNRYKNLLESKYIKELKTIDDLILIKTNNSLAINIDSNITRIGDIVVHQRELIDYVRTIYRTEGITFMRFKKDINFIDISGSYIIFSANKETGDLVDKILGGVFYNESFLKSIISEKTGSTIIGSGSDKTKILTYNCTTRLVNDNVNTIMPDDNVKTVILEDNTKTVFPDDNTKTVVSESNAKTLMPAKTAVKTKKLQDKASRDLLYKLICPPKADSDTKENEVDD